MVCVAPINYPAVVIRNPSLSIALYLVGVILIILLIAC